MTSLEIANLLKDYGPWGICALLILAVVYLHKGWQACQEARVTDGRLATEALTRQASTNTEIATITASLREGQVEMMRVIALLSKDSEHGDESTQATIKGLADAVGRLEQAYRAGAR
ncbi:hypothetical protein ACFQE0_25990 [Methylobacterium komagatae]|uniref:DUF2730 family protein n=1 Tax=Methylobacterium komagatae TaxID=374425 RepID=A0ABW2BST1_9HYPH